MRERKEIDFRELASGKTEPKSAKVMNLILVMVCVALAAAIIFNMYATDSDSAAAKPQEAASVQTVNVYASPAAIGTFTKTSRFNGEIQHDGLDVQITPDTASGTVTEILVKEGDEIKAGDTVAYVDASRPGYPYNASPVVSKASGTVIAIGAAPGQTVSASTPIATVASDAPLVIRTSVPEKFLGTLSSGMTAAFETVAYPGISYDASVTYISPVLSKASRSADVKLQINSGAQELKPGMYVKLYLETERIGNALMIPSSALAEYIGEDVVYVAENGKAVRRTVTIGSDNGTEAAITSGLAEGELVITAGNVTDGSAVNVVS